MTSCPHCSSTETIRRGFAYPDGETYVRMQCKDCNKYFQVPEYQSDKSDGAKIFIVDIETSTILARIWNLGIKGYVNHKDVVKDWFVICWAGMWDGSEEVLHDVVTPQEALYRDDKRVCQSLWNVFEEADVIVAHNGDRFDIVKMNYRWAFHKLIPPLPYRTIDTLKEVRKVWGSTSKALDYLGKQFKISTKLETGRQLWEDCEKGNPEALNKMDEYCVHDVKGLGRPLYHLIRPWMKTGVNLALYSGDETPMCSRCASTDIEYIDGKVFTTGANSYTVYRCNSCGHSGRTKTVTITKEKRKNLLT